MGSYKELWEKLNLDLDAHESLLEVLGKFYGDIYLTQQGRLRGIEYLDFVISEIHGLRIKELQEAKNNGRKVIGTFCIFVPEELVLAAQAIQVGLCAGAETGRELAEQVLPRNTCALIKSFVGFKLSRLCPFIESCDLIVGETTCDGKKKAYEIFEQYVPLFVMEVPQMKRDADRELWKSEIYRFKSVLEDLTGSWITAESLAKGIKTVNRRRRVLQRLNELRKAVPAPISGRDALLVHQISFYDDPERFTNKISILCDELEKRISAKEGVVPEGTPRILLSGCPMAIPNWKLPYVIESSGAVVVVEESCVGTRNISHLVEENGKSVDDMIDNIVDRYMKIDCACFTPNRERLNNVVSLAKAYKVDGVIHYSLTFCQLYETEAFKIGRALEKEGIPFLSISTDYSMEDVEQLKNRVEAFVEMIRG
ncbi:double-cubane-cluster-containing anaerobic reductase [Thermodesulforhabdus norvegica]|uniref:Benzoyl-CoA reductase/2-hydroxyglutaryl-CoA dehydratase subunit, BcrC/BadD/HgdB n=1 Tax=Thermodesulforhabdus norvegica TaxID=39841 RepID=A0A1I4RKF0_9BACT|nr:double-cubane-cluster-containing anaerobic reductase [Thermodesulforhabdus norvegica]SFM52689.1 Benzoyl-CoA reductase/2-hydroxyglutaryl-CoA dehydratase subunit, BcrC/BadD/HgdB [Thermodesulforhabdus norvegica]